MIRESSLRSLHLNALSQTISLVRLFIKRDNGGVLHRRVMPGRHDESELQRESSHDVGTGWRFLPSRLKNRADAMAASSGGNCVRQATYDSSCRLHLGRRKRSWNDDGDDDDDLLPEVPAAGTIGLKRRNLDCESKLMLRKLNPWRRMHILREPRPCNRRRANFALIRKELIMFHDKQGINCEKELVLHTTITKFNWQTFINRARN